MIEIVKNKEFLTKPCELVRDTEEAKEIIKILFEHITNIDNALGLAANQIGINKQIFISKFEDEYFPFVNPKILLKENPFIFKNEQCLSFPGEEFDTIRYKNIEISDMTTSKIKYSGMNATIFQHEYDHIMGKTFHESKAPKKYDLCFCGSNKKFKFCCWNKVK